MNIGLHIIYRIKNIEYRIAVLESGSIDKVWVGSGNNIIVFHLLTNYSCVEITTGDIQLLNS